MTIYSAAGLVLAVTPGPGLFATVARSLASGFRPAIPMICGGTYLIYLGIRIWRTVPQAVEPQAESNGRGSGLKYFSSGLMITLSNPKVMLLYCGFLPTFWTSRY